LNRFTRKASARKLWLMLVWLRVIMKKSDGERVISIWSRFYLVGLK